MIFGASSRVVWGSWVLVWIRAWRKSLRCTQRGPKTAQALGSYILVPRPKTRAMPKTMACRLLMFTWSFGPVISLRNLEAREALQGQSRDVKSPALLGSSLNLPHINPKPFQGSLNPLLKDPRFVETWPLPLPGVADRRLPEFHHSTGEGWGRHHGHVNST